MKIDWIEHLTRIIYGIGFFVIASIIIPFVDAALSLLLHHPERFLIAFVITYLVGWWVKEND